MEVLGRKMTKIDSDYTRQVREIRHCALPLLDLAPLARGRGNTTTRSNYKQTPLCTPMAVQWGLRSREAYEAIHAFDVFITRHAFVSPVGYSLHGGRNKDDR